MHKNDNIAKLKTDREVLIVALQMAKDYLEDQELDEALLKTIQTTLALVNSKTDTESFSKHKNDNIAKLKTDREVLIVALQMAKDYLEDQELDEALLKTIQTTLALVNSKTDTESFSNYTSLVLLFRIALYGAGWGESLTPVSIPCAGVFGANG